MSTSLTERSIEEALFHLKVDGYCIIDGVIPADKVGPVCRSIEATVESSGQTTLVKGAKTRKG